MARLAELIREGAAPRSMVRRAARGELSLPPVEAIEILVALGEDRELAAEAEQTLAHWDETTLCEIAAQPETPLKVLRHLLQSQEPRPAVIAALCGNISLALEELEALARQGSEETLQAMMRSERARSSIRLLELIEKNPAAEPIRSQLAEYLSATQGSEEEQVVAEFLECQSDDLVMEDNQPFELVTAYEGEEDPLAQLLLRAHQGEAVEQPEERQQLSILQKIGRLRVGERIKLAVRGNREERMVLIRDRSKLVSLAVLASPKVNEVEMEAFAAMKNVQESVLRAIAANRKNMKRYGVIKTLANNPKTPLDVALPLLSYLLIKDLRSLAINKNVNDTVRKRAMRMFRAKTDRKTD